MSCSRPAHRSLGATGMSVAPLGLAGSFGIDANAVERAFHELGINYFFVTPRMKGLCEGVRRLVRAGHRDAIVIGAGATFPFGWSVSRELHTISKLLGVETIDVFHLFWVQARWYVAGKTWPTMRRAKEDGRVRALAVSCHDRALAVRLVRELDLDALMIRYNAAHRGAEREIFAALADPRPGIIAYTATRWRKLLQPKDGLRPMTAPECYRFALMNPSVDVVLCGARSWDELEQSARGVAEGPLSQARLDEVRRFGDAVRGGAAGRIGFAAP